MAAPSLPSFSFDDVDVLLHPEVYMLKNDEIKMPDFNEYNVNSEKTKNYVLIPTKRVIKI